MCAYMGQGRRQGAEGGNSSPTGMKTHHAVFSFALTNKWLSYMNQSQEWAGTTGQVAAFLFTIEQ